MWASLLVWPGKCDEEGNLAQVERVNLPFQVIETLNESRATREARTPQLSFFDYWEPQEGDTFEEGWKNKLIWGGNWVTLRTNTANRWSLFLTGAMERGSFTLATLHGKRPTM